jgi:hypothetical protein
MNVTLTTSFRTIPNLTLSQWKEEAQARQSPLTQAELEDCFSAVQGWAVSLDQAIGESSLRDASAIQKKNLLGLKSKDNGEFLSFERFWHGFSEFQRRVYDPGYKSGVYYPAHLGVGGVVPGYDLSLAGYKVIYQGGPLCLSSRGKTCANGERYDPLLPMLGLSTVNNTALPSINRSIAASMERYNRWFGVSTSPPVDPPPGGPTGQVVFGRVAKPAWNDRQIPDANNWAWDNLGQRRVRGVTYHRQQGTNWGTDGWFRGGGGGAGLTDFGIDAFTGETLQWNDYAGRGRQGISPNRAGHASGPWQNPPGDGRAFVNAFGINAINRDLVSFEIDRYYEDPVKEAGVAAIVQLTAWLADQQKIRWDSFPLNPHTGLVFTYEHGEFQAEKPCCGVVVRNQIATYISRARDVLKSAQTGG